MPDVSLLEIQSLVDDVELSDIFYFELSAARYDEEEANVTGDPLQKGDGEDVTIQPNHLLQIARKDGGGAFRIRIRTEIAADIGRIVSDVAAEYEATTIDVDNISEELMLEFVNNVAVMTLVPYIRQSISDITQRVFDSALIMPMVKRGELAFTLADASNGPSADQ